MTYENAAMIPFMLDAAHLTPEELADRSADPASWAGRRYSLPPHIFQAAAGRYQRNVTKHGPSPPPLANYIAPTDPFCPATPRLIPQTHLPPASQAQVPVLASPAPTPSASASTSAAVRPSAPPNVITSPAGSYFSTVLSSSPLEDTPPSSPQQEKTLSDEGRAAKRPRTSGPSVSDKKKGKMRDWSV